MTLSRDDIIWGYSAFLKRPPESEAAIQSHIDAWPDLKAFVQCLLESHEFKSNWASKALASKAIDGFEYDDSVLTQRATLAILRKLQPVTVEGCRKTRIGGRGDGGYVMLDRFEGVEAAYSLGIKDDVSWDLDIAARDIPVYQYDHTIDALPQSHPHFHWFKTGIGPAASPPFDTLHNLLRQNGHANASNLLLKCDIEGAEWDMLAGMPSEDLKRFSQIAIEFHAWQELGNARFASRVDRAITRLSEHHRLIHVHGNNNTALAIVGGIALPAAMEMTFVRTEGLTIKPSTEVFPTGLDAPCWPHRADYCLGTFRFE